MEGCSYGLEDLQPVVEANVRKLQIFNMALFPVPYDAKFYSKVNYFLFMIFLQII